MSLALEKFIVFLYHSNKENYNFCAKKDKSFLVNFYNIY